jgi:DNA-binding transcriptional ArsR family regulator
MRVLAEPTRMQILFALERREASVQELADELDMVHANVSKHLNVLYGAGVLSRRREGSWMRYALADYTTCRLLRSATAAVTGQIEELADLVNPPA